MERKEFDGEWFISHDALCVATYGGYGCVGEANIRTLENLEGAFTDDGAFDMKQLWLPDTPDNQNIIEGLDDYASIDDQVVAEVEGEWEREAWDSWVKSDLLRTLDVEVRDVVEDFHDDLLWEAYREAMEKTNTYPTPEHTGVHVDVRAIADVFGRLLVEELLCRVVDDAVKEGGPSEGTGVIADWCEETGHHLAGVVRYLADRDREKEPNVSPSLEG